MLTMNTLNNNTFANYLFQTIGIDVYHDVFFFFDIDVSKIITNVNMTK